uniref:Uncharacterized protein n=1 Tax=Glycine max TaxID=3847 RepID=C6TLB0_SOYBN|nr:unknown [Glycine max]
MGLGLHAISGESGEPYHGSRVHEWFLPVFNLEFVKVIQAIIALKDVFLADTCLSLGTWSLHSRSYKKACNE